MNTLSRESLVGTTNVYLHELGGTVKIRTLGVDDQRALAALATKRAGTNEGARKMLIMAYVLRRGIAEPELSESDVMSFIREYPGIAARLMLRIMGNLG